MSEDLSPSKKSIIIAVILGTLMVFAVEVLFPRPQSDNSTSKNLTTEAINPPVIQTTENTDLNTNEDDSVADIIVDVKTALQTQRLDFKNDKVSGSIRLEGARIDNLSLLKYTVSQTDKTPITLLAPALTEHAFYAETGWSSTNKTIQTPNHNTIWTVEGNDELAPNKDITLKYENSGVVYKRTISLDDNYMFKIKDEVLNNSGKDLTMFNYGLVVRGEAPKVSTGASHEGITGFFNDKLEEFSYKDLEDEKQTSFTTEKGWFGMADKYWMTMFILPFDSLEHKINFSYNKVKNRDLFQTDYITAPIEIKNGDSYFTESMIFAGAKEINIIDDYSNLYNIKNFDRSIDFGWFYFLTKPFFYILDFFYGLLGNMGWAIILFATLLRLIMYPVANKSYKSMAKMKEVQPKIKELQNRYKNDKMKLNQEMMVLYKKEQINPLSGCLPILIQIPIFFSLYKVLYISIELRQAPFIGWITDLSMPDPTSVFTLLGLLPITLPAFLHIGVWPLLMGITMFIQQKMTPKPADKTQAYIFMFLPIIFTFMLANFAAGLVIYWTWSNILSIIQQSMIKKSMKKYEKK